MNSFNYSFENEFDNFFSGFFGNTKHKNKLLGTIACENCKTTFNEFLNTGKLGCSNCYKVFENRLINPLKQIHGASAHTGKVPERIGGRLKKNRKA